MTRSNAREIAIHMIFELGFGNSSADELLNNEMTPERFAQIGEEEPLYAQFPNEKQAQYIRELVRGTFSHGPEVVSFVNGILGSFVRTEFQEFQDKPVEEAETAEE